MTFKDFLLRAKRPASLVAFNGALPSNFKLIVRIDGKWIERPGVNLDPIASLTLKDAILDGNGDIITPAMLSPDTHYNLRVTDAWSGWAGLFITDPADPDFNDPTLDRSKLKRWMRNNGVERLDDASEHPRSGQTMPWFRWEDPNGIDWMDFTKRAPVFQRRVWL